MPVDDLRLAELVRNARRIAIIGLSPRPERPSHGVARYLQRAGYTIVPVHPAGGMILGEPVHPDLVAAAAVAGPIDLVNVFRRSVFLPGLVPAILEVRPSLVWLQQGVRHEDAARRLDAAGIPVVMDRCLAVYHTFLGV
ncbi:MAG: CoA-binding protein [Gemmatimonadales bacterium]